MGALRLRPLPSPCLSAALWPQGSVSPAARQGSCTLQLLALQASPSQSQKRCIFPFFFPPEETKCGDLPTAQRPAELSCR